MKKMKPSHQVGAFTILELIVAMSMLSIITLVVATTIGQIYLNQKQIVLRQSFHDESRLLMERVVQLVRNNTIDYDRYFLDIGPDVADCPFFNDRQVSDSVIAGNVTNDESGRLLLGYPSIFYWDTNEDGTTDRHLGGTILDGTDDPCINAFSENVVSGRLYLINADRNIRTAILLDDKSTGQTDDDELTIEVEYGVDTDGDLRIDLWGSDTFWDASEGAGAKCEITGVDAPVLGQPNDDIDGQKFCLSAYPATNVLPGGLELAVIDFKPSPEVDPFLAFRVDEVQVHPHVYIDFRTVMKNHEDFGFSANNQPNTRLRTTASSRVFGDSRK